MTRKTSYKLSEPVSRTLTHFYKNDQYTNFSCSLSIQRDTVHTYSWGPVSSRDITYIESKDSLNLPLPLSAEVHIIEEFRRSSPALLKRKPKRPVYNPPKFKPLRKLTLKLVDTTIYKLTPPRVMTERAIARFSTALVKRDKLIDRLNVTRQKRFALAEARQKLIEDKRLQRRRAYDSAYKVRFEKYERRLAMWERSLASLKARIARAERKRVRTTEDHRYMKSVFVNLDPNSFFLRPWSWQNPMTSFPDPCTNHAGGYFTAELFPVTLSTKSGTHVPDAESVVDAHLDVLRKLANTFDPILVPRLYNKLVDEKVDIGNLIAERSQTMSLFRDTVRALAGFISAKKSIIRSLVEFGGSPKRIADEYLKFQFGIRPLLNDYETLINSLASDPINPVVKVRAVQKRIPVFQVIDGTTISGKLEVRYTLRYNTENVLFQRLQEWGFVNPFSIGWEMTPWSFVVDWFYPISDIIKASTADCGLSFISGTRAISFQGTMTTNVTSALDSLYSDHTILTSRNPPRGSWAVKTKLRDVITTPPDYVLPQFKDPISWTHGFESLALLIQKLR